VQNFAIKTFAIATTVTALLATASLAGANTPVSATSLGFDISFPQCNEALPYSPGFGVVGVNNGTPFSVNKCLARELSWARAAADPTPAFYTNTQNPGPAGAANWPRNQVSPYACSGANSVHCSYDYGWNAAHVAFSIAVNAEVDNGVNSPAATAASSRWWLDVETSNQWETTAITRTRATETYDLAAIKGEVAALTELGVVSVGVYSTKSQWVVITGGSGTSLDTVPVWIPGFATLSDAQVGCAEESFTGARVAMIQYPFEGYDGDYVCGLLNSPVSASLPVAQTSSYSYQLITSNNSGPVSYVQTSGSPTLVVSATGLVTTSGTLAPGTYVAQGTTSDASGDVGTFTIALRVGSLAQRAPLTSSVTTTQSSTFRAQLNIGANFGAVTFVQTSGSATLVVSTTGLVTTSGTLAPGTYVARGVAYDATGDKGTFMFALSVIKPEVVPIAQSLTGVVIGGKSVDVTVHGTGFYGQPRITSHPGTVALVVRDTSQELIVRVSSAAHSRNGEFVFTIRFAHGQSCAIDYFQR